MQHCLQLADTQIMNNYKNCVISYECIILICIVIVKYNRLFSRSPKHEQLQITYHRKCFFRALFIFSEQKSRGSPNYPHFYCFLGFSCDNFVFPIFFYSVNKKFVLKITFPFMLNQPNYKICTHVSHYNKISIWVCASQPSMKIIYHVSE